MNACFSMMTVLIARGAYYGYVSSLPCVMQNWEPNAHVCAASAAIATQEKSSDAAFEHLDAAVKAAPNHVVALIARATWLSATRGAEH
eukprot:COSAG06_NODE_764_length_12486_cov_190.016630_16_plen_88_part_00